MKLRDVIETIFEQNDDQTIWVKSGENVTPETEVFLGFKADSGGPPNEAKGYQYFLEVFVAQDLIIGLVGNQRIPKGEVLNIANMVIQYAENDA